MKAILVFLVALTACGSDSSPETTPRAAESPSASQGGCDTAFVFQTEQDSAPVIDAMRQAQLLPIEVHFSSEGAQGGTTGGSIGAPGMPGNIDAVEEQLATLREDLGVEPLIVGIRVGGVVETESLGELAASVHTRMLVPAGAAVAMAPPDVEGDPINVVGGAVAEC